MSRKPLKPQTVQQKLEEMNKNNEASEAVERPTAPEIKEEVKIEKKTKSPTLTERERVMLQHRLKRDLVLIGGEVEFSDSEDFGDILKEYKKEDRYKEKKDRMGWNQKTLAAHYILEGIKRDKKKFGLE